MKFYYKKGACSLAVRILLNELNLTFESIAVDLKTKKTEHGEDFYTINPKGVVPTLILDDGTLLTENVVIQLYLAEIYKAERLLPAIGNMQRYQILTWLNYASTELHQKCMPFINPAVPSDVRNTAFLPLLQKRLEWIDAQLKKYKFIAGETFTLADPYIFTTLTWMPIIGIPLETYPNVLRYFTEMKAWPSVQKSLEQEHLSY